MPVSLAPAPSAYEPPAPPAPALARARGVRDGLLAVAGLTLLLLLPAIFNGYPVVFPDTAEYILRATTLTPSPIRAPGYGVWIRATSLGLSLWLPVVAQSLLLAALVWRTLVALGRPTLRATLGVGLALALGSSAAWASSKAMPDVFTATVVLGLYLAVVHWRTLGAGGRVLAAAGVVIGGTMHLTNVLVGGLLVVVLLLLQLALRAEWRLGAGYRRGALLLLASAALARGFEYVRRDDNEVEFNGSIFLLSHLVETGLAQQLLQERCGQEQFALCPVRDTLTRPIEMFVWRPKQSPRFFVLHDDPALIREEANHILRGVATRHPFALLASVTRYTGEQLVNFRVNDDIWRHREQSVVQRYVADAFPRDLPREAAARQQRNTLRLPWTGNLHLVVFFVAVALSLIALRRAIAARALALDRAVGFQAVVWATLLLNAAVCANLSSVFSRYQSRVSWLLPFAVLAMYLERSSGE